MKELASLHDQHLNRPTLDDSSEQEHAIEITTQEITQVRMEMGPQVGMGISQPSHDPLESHNVLQTLNQIALPNPKFTKGREAELPQEAACVLVNGDCFLCC